MSLVTFGRTNLTERCYGNYYIWCSGVFWTRNDL